MDNLQDYKDKLKLLEADFKVKRDQLAQDYAFSTAKFNVGDIITDTFSTIKITRLIFTISFGTPEVVYFGTALKKDLTPKKSGDSECVYANREITLLKKGEPNSTPATKLGA